MIFYFFGHTTWLGDLSSLAMDQTHAPAMSLEYQRTPLTY